MPITITGGSGRLAPSVRQERAGTPGLVLFDRGEPGKNRFDSAIAHPVIGGDLTNLLSKPLERRPLPSLRTDGLHCSALRFDNRAECFEHP